ncbi:MAG TPA: TolC family protein [Terriglobales bacterium]|nr:TolC family protein [Terriglobales bacterium]
MIRLTLLLALLSTGYLPAQSNPVLPGQTPTAPPRMTLTLQQAEALAIKNNPQISSARLQALAAQQVVREVRSNYWPTAVGNLTAVDSKDNSRITAGGLNNPIIYERGAGGVNVSQQITDFGRTANLVSSAGLNAKAQEQSSLATRQQILLATDQSFYNVLQARAVLRVAEQTVSNRQDVVDQVQALTQSKLKSDLDLSFSQVNFAQARLLRLDAQNNEKLAQATLAAILGYSTAQEFDPVDETTALDAPPADLDTLVQQGIDSRPELRAADYQYQAAEKFMHAERDAFRPSLSALAAIGGTPARDEHLGPWYGAAGVNLQVPIFNGFLFSARAKEADLRAQSVQQRLIDLRNSVARDIRASWLNAKTSYDRLDVTNQLLKQANLALDLSQTRYKLGLGSIVELSQAQLQQTQAEISQAQASYEYRLALDVLRYQTTGL